MEGMLGTVEGKGDGRISWGNGKEGRKMNGRVRKKGRGQWKA